ncbi:MAG: ribonuclease R [Bacteroidetes bacterium]|nr:ribonuclease R [Bacteroidota bacterium]
MKTKTHTIDLSNNAFLTSVLRIFANDPFSVFNYKQISARMGITDKASKELVINVLHKLLMSNAITEQSRGKYKLNPSYINEDLVPNSYVTGKVDMKQTGKAYIIRENESEDIFISANNTNHALHGDKVKVFLFPRRKGRKLEGQVIEIIERAHKQFVGIVQLSKKFAFLVPDNNNVPVDIFIPLDSLNGAKNGEKALARITDWPERASNPFGEIIQVLGKPGDNNVEMQSILAEFDFPLSFPENVEKEADKIPEAIPEKEITKRRDFRNVVTFTIDPEDAKDFDDALSLRKLQNGNWEVGVHIADVSYYVTPNSIIDKEAYERGTSIYLVDRVIPMLPERLSNGVCSLRANEDKLCFSAVFEMDESAHIKNEWFGKTIICSDRRFNYQEAQDIIETGNGDFAEEILTLNKLAFKLRDERFKSGSINFKSTEVKFKLDENGKPLGVFIKEIKDSNRLIEDFMLLANKKVASRIGVKKGSETPKTFVYRVHDEPNAEKLSTFVQFLSKLGYSMKTGSRKNLATSFNNLFEAIEGKGEENMIETIAIRTMAKAYYSTDNIGHYGLAFPYYSHFTSPIRRYPDLMVHRLLEMYMDGKPSVNKKEYEGMCEHSSIMERKAAEAERASIKYKQAEYLQDKIGQTFFGLISGVSKWGLFVELEGNKCEGMVSLRSMIDDYYFLDEDNYQVIGQRYGQKYKLGDRIKIKIVRVDLAKKQMDFVIEE